MLIISVQILHPLVTPTSGRFLLKTNMQQSADVILSQLSYQAFSKVYHQQSPNQIHEQKLH